MKKAVVIGATGLIGKYLVEMLAQQPEYRKVTAISRRKAEFSNPKIENIVFDFANLEQFNNVFNSDTLFSCLGTTKKQAGSVAAQRVVDVDYQLKAAELAANNGVSEYFLVSSSGANDKSKSAYLQMKGELEDKVTQLKFKRICIFQPSLLLGKREGFRFGEKLGSWILPLLCRLPLLKRYKPIYGEQVATKMCQESLKLKTGIQRFTLDACFPDEV
ncbi:NAD(P)H-binding protein [Pseudoalteromonas phenolica]|uniref:NAD(P)H-binding protein n=1 Tax=Pseudoalteromonas phenolica TaxID=161398 RepID=UPI00110B6796|nr:NAD(P)H-binding protein [Pseudoalteromonas phenolica]TMO57247.1 short chain dehydrogenase [Pseudoalteromonas phenolica]